jgi:hypothetical protein
MKRHVVQNNGGSTYMVEDGSTDIVVVDIAQAVLTAESLGEVLLKGLGLVVDALVGLQNGKAKLISFNKLEAEEDGGEMNGLRAT